MMPPLKFSLEIVVKTRMIRFQNQSPFYTIKDDRARPGPSSFLEYLFCYLSSNHQFIYSNGVPFLYIFYSKIYIF